MENASKALIMAAGVLIGILILSLAVYLFTSFGSTSAEVYQKNQENQLNQFNTQFTSYVGADITIYEVITVANLATDNNIFYELPRKINQTDGMDYYISVVLENKTIEFGSDRKSSKEINDTYNNLIKKDINDIRKEKKDLQRYTCTVEISPNTQRVYKVEFKKKNS